VARQRLLLRLADAGSRGKQRAYPRRRRAAALQAQRAVLHGERPRAALIRECALQRYGSYARRQNGVIARQDTDAFAEVAHR